MRIEDDEELVWLQDNEMVSNEISTKTNLDKILYCSNNVNQSYLLLISKNN